MTTTNAVTHRMKWFAYAGGEKFPRTASMRGTWGYDVECSCGWATNSGGGTKGYITREVWFHKFTTEEDS